MANENELYERIFSLESEKEMLQDQIKNLKEEIERIIQDRDENYRPIPVSEQCGVSDYDFY
jgi:predicted nuclease with TOPRIM domain